ncbi:MAG: efflux RND transporter permease subunit [Marinilabiliaceae bacterium]|nr:efflux RND transporter permease subunit [Marinilabiliaceae bacterium]
MKKLIAYFIKFPLAVNLLMVMVFLFGLIALSGIQKNFFPNVPQRNIYVDIVYPGASPEEIEEGAILKIEENIKGLSDMERITSVSRENMGTVTIEMVKGTDMDEALTRVKNEVEKISSFPVNVESVVTYKHDDMNFAVNFALTPNEGREVSLKKLKEIAREIEHDLLRIEGISKITIGGYPDEEIAILLDEHAMESYQLTFSEVSRAVASTNLIMTGGSIKDGEEEFFIRVRNKAYRSEGLEDIVIRNSAQGGIIRLKDVATIKDQWADSPSDIEYNDKQAIVFTINTTFKEDIMDASEKINTYLDAFNEEQDLLTADIIRDQSDTLNQRIDLLMDNGLLGIILVLIFLSLFLNPRIAFWVAVGIPFSMLGMFIIIPATSVTINMLSLFGLILVLGILVDDAIVVGENVYRHWQMGKSPVKAAVDGTLEVTPAVVSGVLTTMLAFSTFIFLDGRLGDMFKEVSIIVMVILLVSLVEGLIVLPAHMAHSKALKKGSDKKWTQFMGWSEKGLVWVREKIYRPILEKSIHYKSISLAVFTALFIIAIGMVSNQLVNVTFFPEVEGDNFTITLTMPSGTDESVTQKELDKISAAIWEVNEEMRDVQPDGQAIIKQLFQQFKGAGNNATIEVTLLDAEVRNSGTDEVIQLVRQKVGDIPGAETLGYAGFNPFGKALVLSLVGDDNKELQAAKEELKLALKNMPELADVSDNSPVGNREIEIELKDKAHHLGVTLQDVISQVREAFFGNEVQRLQRGKDEVKVWVKYDEENRRSLGQLEGMKIRLGNGTNYPLSELAFFKMVNGVTNIRHLSFDREVQLEANQSDPHASLPQILKKLETEVLQPLYDKYPGVKAKYDGQKRETDKVANSAKVVFPVVLLLMFGMVILTLRSVSQSVLVYMMIPLSFVGVVAGHWIHGMALSLMSAMGMIALIGVMINDGLVLINALNINLKQGMPYQQALLEAAISRFRPILLTTLTTVAGMAPMVLETSLQAQFLIPVSLSLAYGMIMATTTTLLLLPVMLLMVNSLKVKIQTWIKGQKVSAEEVENAIKEMNYNYEEA